MKKVWLYQILVFTIRGKTWKNSYNNNKFKISVPVLNDVLQLPDGWYSISDIQDYFENISKEYNEMLDNLSIRIYINKIENRITFKIKTRYYLKLLTPETMKLLGSTENKINKDKNSENIPHLQITGVVLNHFNIINNDYPQDSRVLHTFVPDKPFGILLEVSPKNHIFLKIFNFKFQAIEVWFTDQNSQP